MTLTVEFEAQCAAPGSTATTVRVGSAEVALLRRQGDAFSFDVATDRSNEEPWTGTISGTISPDAIVLDVRANATIEGEVCDTGALTLTLDERLL